MSEEIEATVHHSEMGSWIAMSVMSKEIEATVHQSLMGMRIAAVSVMSV